MSEKTIPTQFRLTDSERAFLEDLGDGIIAEGLRVALEIAGYTDLKKYYSVVFDAKIIGYVSTLPTTKTSEGLVEIKLTGRHEAPEVMSSVLSYLQNTGDVNVLICTLSYQRILDTELFLFLKRFKKKILGHISFP